RAHASVGWSESTLAGCAANASAASENVGQAERALAMAARSSTDWLSGGRDTRRSISQRPRTTAHGSRGREDLRQRIRKIGSRRVEGEHLGLPAEEHQGDLHPVLVKAVDDQRAGCSAEGQAHPIARLHPGGRETEGELPGYPFTIESGHRS